MTDRFSKFTLLVTEAYRQIHRIADKELKTYGLKGQHAILVKSLFEHCDGLTSTQLTEYCGKDKADVSRFLLAMKKKGIIETEDSESGAYRAKHRLTESGMRIAYQLQKRIEEVVKIAGADIDEGDRVIFYDALESIATNLRRIADGEVSAKGKGK